MGGKERERGGKARERGILWRIKNPASRLVEQGEKGAFWAG